MQNVNLTIAQGKTFSRTLRWAAKPYTYAEITGITQAAPARVTAVAHGLPDGWRAAVVSVKGMRQINADGDPPKDSDYHKVTVIDVDTVEINDINAAGFSAYVSGGYLQALTPISLSGCTAKLTVRDRIGGTALVTLTSSSGIVLDDTSKTIVFTFTAAATAAWTWTHGVYELEIQDGGGEVTCLMRGSLTVTPKEIAT